MSTSLAIVEICVSGNCQCPHCGTLDTVSRRKARDLRMYQCNGCKKAVNAATSISYAGLHRKDKWLIFRTCLAFGVSVRASAELCGFAVNTAFRWRYRFLAAESKKPRKLTGIVKADQTNVLESQKDKRVSVSKVRHRGGKGKKRGLLDDQVPVLAAVDRSDTTVSAVLPAVNADALQPAIELVVDEDFDLVTDGYCPYPRWPAAFGANCEGLNLSGGKRVKGIFYVQTVSNRHSKLTDFLGPCQGVTTKYLDIYLRRFWCLGLEFSSPRACLTIAIGHLGI